MSTLRTIMFKTWRQDDRRKTWCQDDGRTVHSYTLSLYHAYSLLCLSPYNFKILKKKMFFGCWVLKMISLSESINLWRIDWTVILWMGWLYWFAWSFHVIINFSDENSYFQFQHDTLQWLRITSKFITDFDKVTIVFF